MPERARRRRSPEGPWDRAPIFSSRYRVRQLLNNGEVDAWRRGSYMPEDQGLARSRENAFLSARQYLQQDEPAEFKGCDRHVRCSSSHGKRKFATNLNYVQEEGYFTRKRVIQNEGGLMRKNLRCHTDGIAPSFSISPVRENAKKANRGGLNQTACLNSDYDDDELEEGQLTPPTRSSSPSLSLSSSKLETEINDSVSPIKYSENPGAVDVTPTSKKKMYRSIDFSPSQFKKRKKRSSMESHIIVVCGQGSNKQQHNFADNRERTSLLEENINTGKHRKGYYSRKEGLMLTNGLDPAAGKAVSKFNANVRTRIDSNFGELRKLNTISALRNAGCPAANDWKPLQQEGNLGEDKSIVHRKDGQGSPNSGDMSEVPGKSLQGDQVAHISKIMDQCKQQQNLSPYSDVMSEVNISLCVQHAPVGGQNFLGINYMNGEGSKGNVGSRSTTDTEIEKVRDMGYSKDCGSLSKVDVTEKKISEVITSVKENVSVPNTELSLQVSEVDSCFNSETMNNRTILPLHKCLPFDGNENVNSLGSVNSLVSLTELSFGMGISEAGPCEKERMKSVTDHLGMHISDLPVKHVYPDIDLILPSGTSEDIVPFQEFISTIRECDLQLNDIGEKGELGKPCFTEATSVSSLVPMTMAAANSTVIFDNHGTVSESKQVDFMKVTLNSDTPMAKLNVQQIANMRYTMEPNISTALKDNHLDSKAPSYVEFSGSYTIDPFNFHGSPCKKLKSVHNANMKINFTQGSCSHDSHFSVVTSQKCHNSTLSSDVRQQLSISPSQGLHHNDNSSHNSWETQPPLKPSTKSSQIRPRIVGGLFNRIKTWTWIRSDNVVEPASKVPNATSPIGAQSQPAAYLFKGNSLVRASGLPTSLHDTTWGASECPASSQQFPLESSYTRNPPTTSVVAKIEPSTVKMFDANLDISESSIEGFLPPAASCLLNSTTLQVSRIGSAPSLADTMTSATSREAEALYSRLPVSDTVDVNDGDSPGKANTSVGSHVTGIPSNCTLLVGSNRSRDLMLNSRSGTTHLKGKSNQLPSAPACQYEASTCFMDKSRQFQLAGPGPDHHHKMNSYHLFQRRNLTDKETMTTVRVSNESSLPESSQKPTLKTSQNCTTSLTKLGRVLKKKKRSTSLSSGVSSLDTGHPQSPSLLLFQTNKIVPSLLPWKRPVYVADHSKRIKCSSKVRKGSSYILTSKKLQCLQNTQVPYSRSADGLFLHRLAATSLGGSNLKWTKLIDKCTVKDNGEATITDAAVEKWKKEDKDNVAGDVVVEAKEQAKRLVAYEGFSCNSDASHMRCTTNTQRIPTISGLKYIQVGNGNLLGRDPITISRALASEKIRWSLHTVRSILSKKQQYCQFFTEFGNCNKEVGICPYTHDSKKVTICTRFLKGTCSNMQCRLTHKVIPERMPDCSYFLLGICTHESCPYRHVNVNPKAPICDGFLKGFCADSDKCRKKHTYVCPQYASTGDCSERSICKFHHPKRKIKSKFFSHVLKRNGKDRGCSFVTLEDLGDNQSPSSSMNLSGKGKKGVEGVSVEDETAADYISLSTSEEDTTEDDMTKDNIDILRRGNPFFFEVGLQNDDPDMLLKPVLLLRQ